MFKDARQLDRERTASSFDTLVQNYQKTAETWFDGSVDSIDRRLARVDRLLHRIDATVARVAMVDAHHYLGALTSLCSDREALASLRHDLLTGAENYSPIGGTRTASRHKLSSADQRWVTLEAASFVSQHTDALGAPDELAQRAAHHAGVKTSTFTADRSRAITAAFTEQVLSLGAQMERPAVRTAAAVFEDFEPEGLFVG